MTLISFFIPGIPKPAGSKASRALYRKGRMVCKPDGSPVIITHDMSGSKGKKWRQTVATVAKVYFRGINGFKPLQGPLRLCLEFIMPRPQRHYSKETLKPNAPWFHTSPPDATKLVRAVEDSLTGILWEDDAKVCQQYVTKRYGSKPGVHISVSIPDVQMTLSPVEETEMLPGFKE